MLKRVKSIKQDTKFTVSGYIRQNEKKLSLFCNVPDMISYLCLLYYFHGEYFEKTGDDIRISKNKMRVTKIVNNNNFRNTSYGKTWIESTVQQMVQWKFKIDKIVYPVGDIYICLVSTDNRLNQDCNDKNRDKPNFAIGSPGWVIVNGDEYEIKCYVGANLVKYGENDIISMILDTKHRQLCFKRNDGNKITLVKCIKIDSDIKYKMAVSLRSKGDSISLIDFQRDLI